MPIKLMRKLIYLLTVFTLVNCAAKAQFTSLNAAEIKRLKQLVTENPDAKTLYLNQQKLADAALTEKPAPIDTLHTEGRLKGDPQKTATNEALKDMQKMYALALVYRLFDNQKYLNQTVAYLTAWAKINRSAGDPIDDTNLDDGIAAYDLIKEKLNPKDNEAIKSWLIQVAEAEINSPRMKPNRETSYNNWNSHRLKIVGEIAYTLNDDDALKQFTIDGFKTQIAKNLKPDGSSIDFDLRDALHYHVYDLEPLLKLIIVLKRASGTDYYSYTSANQTSVKKSVEWLVPYLTGEKTHSEYVNSKVDFDRKRAQNNEAAFKIGANFKPESGKEVMSLAAYFQPSYISILKKLENTTATYPNWQSVLNAAMH
jgi:hypothetical protein